MAWDAAPAYAEQRADPASISDIMQCRWQRPGPYRLTRLQALCRQALRCYYPSRPLAPEEEPQCSQKKEFDEGQEEVRATISCGTCIVPY